MLCERWRKMFVKEGEKHVGASTAPCHQQQVERDVQEDKNVLPMVLAGRAVCFSPHYRYTRDTFSLPPGEWGCRRRAPPVSTGPRVPP